MVFSTGNKKGVKRLCIYHFRIVVLNSTYFNNDFCELQLHLQEIQVIKVPK